MGFRIVDSEAVCLFLSLEFSKLFWRRWFHVRHMRGVFSDSAQHSLPIYFGNGGRASRSSQCDMATVPPGCAVRVFPKAALLRKVKKRVRSVSWGELSALQRGRWALRPF